VHAHPLSLPLPSPVKLSLFHLYQYMYSVGLTAEDRIAFSFSADSWCRVRYSDSPGRHSRSSARHLWSASAVWGGLP
jgi:hypothetical protein